MTQPIRKTFLPQNQFNSTSSDVDEAGASPPAPTPDAPAALSVSVEPGGRSVVTETEAAVSVRAAASDMQSLGALSGTDLIHEIFAAKPKHFKLKHKLKRPPFAPDYEALEAAMNNPNAPRVRADDPVWSDEPPLFLRGE